MTCSHRGLYSFKNILKWEIAPRISKYAVKICVSQNGLAFEILGENLVIFLFLTVTHGDGLIQCIPCITCICRPCQNKWYQLDDKSGRKNKTHEKRVHNHWKRFNISLQNGELDALACVVWAHGSKCWRSAGRVWGEQWKGVCYHHLRSGGVREAPPAPHPLLKDAQVWGQEERGGTWTVPLGLQSLTAWREKASCRQQHVGYNSLKDCASSPLLKSTSLSIHLDMN